MERLSASQAIKLETMERNTDFIANAVAASIKMLPSQPRRWMAQYGKDSFEALKRKGVIQGCEHLLDDMQECLELAQSSIKPIVISAEFK